MFFGHEVAKRGPLGGARGQDPYAIWSFSELHSTFFYYLINFFILFLGFFGQKRLKNDPKRTKTQFLILLGKKSEDVIEKVKML